MKHVHVAPHTRPIMTAPACRWLVSLSYRVVFRRDPIAEDSTKNPFHTLKHVHGAVYISDDSMQPGTQPKGQLARADMRDHTAEAYSGALNQTCSRSMHRESAVGGCQVEPPPQPIPPGHPLSAPAACRPFNRFLLPLPRSASVPARCRPLNALHPIASCHVTSQTLSSFVPQLSN